MIDTWRRSLRVRIIAFNAVTLLGLLIAVAVVQQMAVRTGLMRSIDRELMRRTQRLMRTAREGGTLRGPLGREGSYRPRLLSHDGTVTSPTGVDGPIDPEGWPIALKEGVHFGTLLVDGEELRVVSRRFGEGDQAGVIQVPYPLTEVRHATEELTSIQLWLSPLALLLAVVVGMILTDRVLRPTRTFIETAEKIGAQHLSARLEVRGDDEFARLAATFNNMLARLESSFEEQRRFTGDASHELQTPLAVIKANTSLSLGGGQSQDDLLAALREIETAADNMSTLVQDLLLLARSDSGGLARVKAPIAVPKLVDRAIARVAHRPGPRVEVTPIPEGLTVRGSEDELTRLLSNLLENALRYTPVSGSITVSCRRTREGVEISVVDTGSGIGPEDLKRVGERFFRVSASRTRAEGGTGLGLSICMGIAKAHGGSVVLTSDLGRGTTATVRLP